MIPNIKVREQPQSNVDAIPSDLPKITFKTYYITVEFLQGFTEEYQFTSQLQSESEVEEYITEMMEKQQRLVTKVTVR